MFEERNCLHQAKEKGASAWLSALPVAAQGYTLNKREFRDSLALRYGWPIQDMPRYCACQARNSVDHALTCSLGGYSHMRHNNLRDTIAQLLIDSHCHDVVTEPHLLPVDPERFQPSTNTQQEARLDIAATGLYSPFFRDKSFKEGIG